MRIRRFPAIAASLSVGMAGLSLLVLCSASLQRGVTMENYSRLQFGMTEPDVENLLKSSGEIVSLIGQSKIKNMKWQGADLDVYVLFWRDEARAIGLLGHGAEYGDWKEWRSGSPERSFFGKVRRFLGIPPAERKLYVGPAGFEPIDEGAAP